MTASLPNANPTTPEEQAARVDAPAIRWPERYEPAKSKVFVSNEIIVPAPVEQVWAWLIRAELWPRWYANSKDIHFLSHAGPDLRDRSRFRWKTFGVKVTSKVREFEPGRRLAWDAHGIGIEAWHGWVLTPLHDADAFGSTHVLTEETQHGWLASLGKRFAPTRTYEQHQLWLEGLSRQAQSGMPDRGRPLTSLADAVEA
jgi:uncharacterized protein YndB with AHSA1/START domain